MPNDNPQAGSESTTGAERPSSFAALVEMHARLAYRIAFAVTRQAADAEDAVQETFLELFRGQRWRAAEDAKAYVARVCWRQAVRKRRRPQIEAPEDVPSPRAGPDETAIGRELEQWLHARIDALPEKLRQPLALAALGELKMTEIAALLGLPEGTVRRRIHDARARLKRELAAREGTCREQGR